MAPIPSSLPKAGKKRTKVSKEDCKEIVANIRSLERAVLNSKANLNNIVSIYSYSEDEHPPKVIYGAIHSLHRIYSQFFENGDLKRPKNSSTTLPDDSDLSRSQSNDSQSEDPKLKVNAWLRSNYIKYTNRLLSLLSHSEPGLQVASLNLLMDLTRLESIQLNQHDETQSFNNEFFVNVLRFIILNENFNDVFAEALMEKYVNVFDDLRFWLLKDLGKIIDQEMAAGPGDNGFEKEEADKRPSKKLKKSESRQIRSKLDLLAENAFVVLDKLSRFPSKPDDINTFLIPITSISSSSNTIASSKPVHQLTKHKQSFSNFVLSYLRLPTLTIPIYKRVLLMMHKKILPNLPDPKVLMSFLTESYNLGGSVSLLALNGVFTLIKDYNLDYPDFYKKLYALFDRNLNHVKYRSKFYTLVDLFLRSPKLPSYLVAAFIKRMARLTLTSPPGGILIIIPMIYNLLKRHPSCMVLIHRTSETDNDSTTDPYDPDTSDPYATNALSSSLWELQTLKSHYYPNISTLIGIFEERLTKMEFKMEEWTGFGYSKLVETSCATTIKKPPALNFDISKQLFTEKDLCAELFDGLL
ncbi:CBF/Mak21 family-domain-containing protein [Paraphysoderma sedebokerense]|nr:CBF/Mak21 family-domain-containing protein [Paraphysoderma sedebokerense]